MKRKSSRLRPKIWEVNGTNEEGGKQKVEAGKETKIEKKKKRGDIQAKYLDEGKTQKRQEKNRRRPKTLGEKSTAER